MRNKWTMIVYVCVFLFACKEPENVEKLIVASDPIDCIGVAPQQCLLVKSGEETEWTFLYGGIEGFDYQPGYEYVLKVQVQEVENPVADQSSIRYILIKVISKEKKTSENLPVFPSPEDYI
ncbi:MAG: DUF4377 domain-containing protein [Tannerellaceae bacterium]|nr:DUF4377 domain-containing protein [Tannerellaceae bacterium]MCC8197246.1 DUF4377 domain-containing protein [Tannerellaceae bacterium]